MTLPKTNPPLRHGTAINYRRGCRCDLCKEAMSEQVRARLAENARVDAMIADAKIALEARLERSGRR